MVAPTIPRPGDLDSARRWVDASWASVHRWGSNRVFQDFADPDLGQRAPAYDGSNLPRLARLKARDDPTGFFRRAQTPR